MSKPTSETAPAVEAEINNDEVVGIAFRRSLLLFTAIAVIAGGVYWWYSRQDTAPPIRKADLALPTSRAIPQVKIPPMPFVDITAEAGIDFVHENGAYGDKLLPETMGSGCAFLDYDADGDQDILFVNSQRWPWDKRSAEDEPPATLKLYQNDGQGKFEDATKAAGLDVSLYGMGVAVGDYDGDSQIDIFISAVGANRLFRNVGSRFEDTTEQAGVAGSDSAWSTSTGWFDYDNDGDLDLFVCNYIEWSKEADLSQNFQLIGGGRAYGRPQQFGGAMSYLYQNQGDGTFADVSKPSGIEIANSATGVPVGKSLGVAFADFDADGWLDIFVANDTVANFLFRNQRDGTFAEVGHLTGVAYDTSGLARGAMGVDVARFRNNDEIGIAIGNFANEMTALYVAQGRQLQFKDDAVSNGLGPQTRLELTFGLFFADADFDGRLDLIATNGHLEEDINKVQRTQQYAQPPHFFWNCGPEHDNEFLPVPTANCGESFYRPLVGRGASYADIDGDGDLDVLFTACGGPARLLRNDQQVGNHWLRVLPVGRSSNRSSIGATVTVVAGGKTQSRLVSPTKSYLSQSELPLTFGLGDAAMIEKISVRWPSGKTVELADVAANQVLKLEEPE